MKKIWKWVLALCAIVFAAKTVKRKKKKKKTALAPPPPAPVVKYSESSARPKPMGHSSPGVVLPIAQTNMMESNAAPTFTQVTQGQNMAKAAPAEEMWQGDSLTDSDLANMPLENLQLPQREPVVENVPELFKAAGYQLIENVKTSLQKLAFLAVGSDKIYAVLMDREPGDWLAEEEPFNGEAPLWFSEVDHRVSPVYELKQSAAELQAKIAADLPGKSVQAFMIEEKGNIINAEEMMRVWQELDVVVGDDFIVFSNVTKNGKTEIHNKIARTM